ncbi:hypothetical protein ACH492_22425 [Streptomyces sp. NPDC019443]|uniref:hypothetical protein n=1 Tax=Streptomyces sp. NPDC019443 TaxID=3365061 RepID=UPI0037B820E1
MPDRQPTATELTAMFEATDNAELARQERALRAEATTTAAADLTPTQQAIAAMRAQRAALGYPATGPEWLLLDALDESERENARLRQETAELRTAQTLAASLTERLAALQDGNEGAYRELYDAMNGPHFCPDRPFGQPAAEQVTA